MVRIRTFVAGALVIATAVSVQAQAPVGPSVSLVLSPVAGLAAMSGSFGDAYDPGLGFGLEADVKVGPLFGITGSVVYNKVSPKLTGDDVTFLEMGAGLKYTLVPAPAVKPHIRGGAAMYSADVGGASSETKFGLNAGAGVDIDLPASKLGFTASARFHKIFVSGTSWQYVNLYGGLRFKVL
jgi:hypothetical protein